MTEKTIKPELKAKNKLIILIVSLVLTIIIAFWVIYEGLGYCLIKGVSSKTNWVRKSSAWCLNNFPVTLTWQGAKKDAEFSIQYYAMNIKLDSKHASLFEPLFKHEKPFVRERALALVFYLAEDQEAQMKVLNLMLTDVDSSVRGLGGLTVWAIYTGANKIADVKILNSYLVHFISSKNDKYAIYSIIHLLRSYVPEEYYKNRLFLKIANLTEYWASFPGKTYYWSDGNSFMDIVIGYKDNIFTKAEMEAMLVQRMFSLKQKVKMEPSTIEKAVAELMKDEEAVAMAKYTLKSEIWKLHMYLGMKIRNDFQLWGDNYLLLSDCKKKLSIPLEMEIHPDSASSVIINELYKKVKQQNQQN